MKHLIFQENQKPPMLPILASAIAKTIPEFVIREECLRNEPLTRFDAQQELATTIVVVLPLAQQERGFLVQFEGLTFLFVAAPHVASSDLAPAASLTSISS